MGGGPPLWAGDLLSGLELCRLGGGTPVRAWASRLVWNLPFETELPVWAGAFRLVEGPLVGTGASFHAWEPPVLPEGLPTGRRASRLGWSLLYGLRPPIWAGDGESHTWAVGLLSERRASRLIWGLPSGKRDSCRNREPPVWAGMKPAQVSSRLCWESPVWVGASRLK